MDPDKVAAIAVAGMNFAWQGQSCGSTSRLLLHESLHKPVLERVVERVAALRVGDPLDDKSQMGPINSKRHYTRVCSMVQSGISDGAKLMTGGKRPPGSDFKRGYWLEPTVFADVNPNMRIAREEIFGPVLSVFSWKDENEALALANATEYGLTERGAQTLLGQAAEYEIANVVDPNFTVVAKIRKAMLPRRSTPGER